MSLKHRDEIDGLRAVAVLPVILFHAGFETFSGGFVGVDVFFVISGFLITGIIRAEMTENRFSIVSFYERRARRLLPALCVVMICCIPFAWLWMLPREFESFGNALWSVSLFGSNFLFWRTTGYFGGAAELNPLLHTWSLAVEEQFYLFFPLLLIAVRWMRANLLLLMLIALSILSLVLAEVLLASGHGSAAFYLLPTRAWELGVGAIAAILYQSGRVLPRSFSDVLAATGLGLIFVAIFVFDSNTPFPGIYAVVPVFGTAAVLMFARRGSVTAGLLSIRPMVWIGLISYSAYLWHQPVLAFARLRSETLPDWALLACVIFSLVLGALSWRYVEQPFRRRDMITRKWIFSLSATASVVLVGIGLYVAGASGMPERLPERAVQIAKIADERRGTALRCIASPVRSIPPNKACVHGGDLPVKVALWGDSHANALAGSVGEIMATRGSAVVELSFANCPPVRAVRTSLENLRCPQHNELASKYILGSDQIETVVLIARWSFYFEGSRFDNGEGGVEFGAPSLVIPVKDGDPGMSLTARKSALENALRNEVIKLLEGGKKVVILGPIPEAGWDVPYYLARKVQHNPKQLVSELSTSAEVYLSRSASASGALNALPEHPNLTILDPSAFLCGGQDQTRCMLTANEQPLYRDDDHLSKYGSDLLLDAIWPKTPNSR